MRRWPRIEWTSRRSLASCSKNRTETVADSLSQQWQDSTGISPSHPEQARAPRSASACHSARGSFHIKVSSFVENSPDPFIRAAYNSDRHCLILAQGRRGTKPPPGTLQAPHPGTQPPPRALTRAHTHPTSAVAHRPAGQHELSPRDGLVVRSCSFEIPSDVTLCAELVRRQETSEPRLHHPAPRRQFRPRRQGRDTT
jgi:hypothetical protein